MAPHKPIRTCVGCGTKRFKTQLLRFVRTIEGLVEPDEAANKPGRAVYLCGEVTCAERAQKSRSFERHLKAKAPADFSDTLRRLISCESGKSA